MMQNSHQLRAQGDGAGHGALEPLVQCEDHHVVVGRLAMAPVSRLRMLGEEGGQQRILYSEKSMGDDDQTLGNGHEQYHGHSVGVDDGNHGNGVEEIDGKLGAMGAEMLEVEQKMEPRESQMSDGDVGTTNSPQVGKLHGRSSRDPAIEWSASATAVLLQAFGEKYWALDRGNFTSKIWADVAARVNSRGSLTVMEFRGVVDLSAGNLVEGIPKTQEQCRIKVDNLKKRYKVEREKKRVSVTGTSKWIFYEMMDDLIGANPRHMRCRGGLEGEYSPLGLENGTPLGIRSSGEEGVRNIYLEGPGGGIQASETISKISPIQGLRKRRRALEDLERQHVNAPALLALFDGHNVPPNIIEAMLQEDMDEYTLIHSRDITVLLDQLRSKHRLLIKLGPAERIKQAIEAVKEKKNSMTHHPPPPAVIRCEKI